MRKNGILLVVALLLLGGAGLTYYLRERADRAAMREASHPKPATPGAPGSVDEIAASGDVRRPVLARELFRQAVTDRVLESPGKPAGKDEWDVDVLAIKDHGLGVCLGRPATPWAFQKLIEIKKDYADYADATRDAEAFSRNEFRKVVAPTAPP